MFQNNIYQFIYSKFTREKGFVDIETSLKIPKNQSIKILNTFIPQGASPMGSFRISCFEDKVGVGYYWMENPSTSHLFALLTKKQLIINRPFLPPYPIDYEGVISKRNLVYSKSDEINLRWEEALSGFSKHHISSMMYSILTGDNILIVDRNANHRMNLINLFLKIMPANIFSYNRITSGCAELDGNENIVGVDELPKKYRSAKKLFLPIDTIFVDLEIKSVEGDGMKTCTITDELAENVFDDINSTYEFVNELLRSVKRQKNINREDILDQKFIDRIQLKLGLRQKIEEDWMMF